MFEEPPAGLFRADPKRGGQKTLSCSPKLTMSQDVLTRVTYFDRMRIECIATVGAEAFEVIE